MKILISFYSVWNKRGGYNMKIISYGYKIPELKDKDFWESYNFDVTRLSTHNHDGNNSAHLAPGASFPYQQLVTIADWVGGSPNFTYDFEFPIGWQMTWPEEIGDPDVHSQSPVLATVRNPAGTIVMLKQLAIREPLVPRWGIRFITTVPLDCSIEII